MLKQISFFYKLVGLLLIISISIIAYAKIASPGKAFSQAKDFPEGALVYAQFQDLPALYKVWDESELKQKYLESTNFNQFENKHLAMKLVSRLKEFQAASKFPLDITAVLSSSETSAAIAVYDIGRLEFVFVAPLSEKKMLASQFVLNKSAFEEAALEDGTVFYSKNVEADRGKQRQKMLFATLRGRFILATDEVKFFKTLAIVGGKSKDKNLFDAPEFKFLSEKIMPHQATIWVDQRKLNDDWYFKHYWAFKNLENLKKIRAGIFDFEMQENKFIERRKFLLNNKSAETTKISAVEINNLQKFIPEDVPHFKFQAIDNSSDLVAKEIRRTLLDGFLNAENKNIRRETHYNRYYFEDYSDNYWETNYKYWGGKYEAEIDEDEDDSEINERDLREESKLIGELNQIIQAANPKTSASLISPQIMPMPLFFESRRAFVLYLGNAKNLNHENLEKVISELANNQLTVSKNTADLQWKNAAENGKTWRELEMPMLGWKLVYSLQNNELVFANSEILLQSMLENNASEEMQTNGKFDEFTTIRFKLHDQAFDSIMSEIRKEESKNEENESLDFFVDNVGSLFDVLSNVNRVEIKKSSSNNYLFEELEYILE